MSEPGPAPGGKAPFPFRDLAERLGRLVPARWRAGAAIVPVVRLSGAIGMASPLRPSLTLAAIDKALARAFAISGASAVALAINSPGGSPVQSHLIFRRIRQLADENELPVLAFVEDVAASGGYMLACAADEIFCDPSSIVGSIGVVSASFGFQEAIARLGIERRIYTAGARKAQLDPFLPQDEAEVAHLRAIQQEVHRHFIGLVRARRGERLQGEDAQLFSGEFWAGGQAVELGLADGLGDLREVLRARFGEDLRLPVIGAGGGLLTRLLRRGGVRGAPDLALAGSGFGAGMVASLEERALWGRYGL